MRHVFVVLLGFGLAATVIFAEDQEVNKAVEPERSPASINVSPAWSAPDLYYGGLHTSPIYYQNNGPRLSKPGEFDFFRATTSEDVAPSLREKGFYRN